MNPEDRAARRRAYDPARRRSQPARTARVSGYNHDSQARSDARMNELSAARRSEIASMGGLARSEKYGHKIRYDDSGHPISGAGNPAVPASQRAALPEPPAAPAPDPPRRSFSSPAWGDPPTPAQRAAASRPARRRAQREREAAKRGQP